MIRPIMHDEAFLSKPSVPATLFDLQVAEDLKDTLKAHEDACVGMAANMIGVSKRIIIFNDNGVNRIMLNPEIVSKTGEYETEEGCLSLEGERPAVRYRKITVKFTDEAMKEHTERFRDFTAQIIQHECDHLDGVII